MCPLVQLLPRVINWINLPSKWSHSVRRLRVKGCFSRDDARHYAPARLRFHASGRATFCSATSSALWRTQVAFHGSSFAGPLPSAAPVTDGNEDVWVFLWVTSLLQNKPNMPWSRVCVCVFFFFFSLPTRGKTKFLKDFCWVLPHSLKGSRLNWLCVELLILESSLQASVEESLQSHEWGMKMNKSTLWSRACFKCSHVLFRIQ